MIVATLGSSCACPGQPIPATCPAPDGVFLEWRRVEVPTWTVAARFGCIPTSVDPSCGTITPGGCLGLGEWAVPLVRHLPFLPAGTGVRVRIVPYRVGSNGLDVRACDPTPDLGLCWPFVREYGFTP
jgi:hypothetical protein